MVDAGAVAVAAALVKNASLQGIELNNTNISDGAKALLQKALRKACAHRALRKPGTRSGLFLSLARML